MYELMNDPDNTPYPEIVTNQIEQQEFDYSQFDMTGKWIGVDFDGTLAIRPYNAPKDDWNQDLEPVPAMVERIKLWLSQGIEVRLVTARVACGPFGMSNAERNKFVGMQYQLLCDWCTKHIGRALPMQINKDPNMFHLYDDRAVCVERNTGRILGINSKWESKSK